MFFLFNISGESEENLQEVISEQKNKDILKSSSTILDDNHSPTDDIVNASNGNCWGKYVGHKFYF
jgi:hypothetical protein